MTKKMTHALEMVGLMTMIAFFSLALFNLLALKTFSLNLIFWGFAGAAYYFADKINKNSWQELLALLPAFVGILIMMLQDMANLPLQTDLEILLIIIYGLALANVAEKKEEN